MNNNTNSNFKYVLAPSENSIIQAIILAEDILKIGAVLAAHKSDSDANLLKLQLFQRFNWKISPHSKILVKNRVEKL